MNVYESALAISKITLLLDFFLETDMTYERSYQLKFLLCISLNVKLI